MSTGRVIAHVDMDAFFAAIAQLDDPRLRGKPVIVGGHSEIRGVVASASYEARRFGVRSAMPLYEARDRCREAIVVPVNMDRYREVNAQLRDVWARFSPDVEPVGFEEAYLDLSGTERLLGHAEQVARAIQAEIARATKLTSSVGVGSSKLLAKIGSKANKPNGVCLVPPGHEAAWLHPRDVSVIPGVGPKLRARLALHGIHTVGELAEVPLERLIAAFKRAGADLYLVARGLDPRPVTPPGPPKSIGGEETFDYDSADPVFLRHTLLKIAYEIVYRLRKQRFVARTVAVKFRYGRTFETHDRAVTMEVPADDEHLLYATACELLTRHWDGRRPLRLVGMTLANFSPDVQLSLFEAAQQQRRSRLHDALDGLRGRFGFGIIRPAWLLPPAAQEPGKGRSTTPGADRVAGRRPA